GLRIEQGHRARGVARLQLFVVALRELSGCPVEFDLLDRQQRLAPRRLLELGLAHHRDLDEIRGGLGPEERRQQVPGCQQSDDYRRHQFRPHQSSTSASACRRRASASAVTAAGSLACVGSGTAAGARRSRRLTTQVSTLPIRTIAIPGTKYPARLNPSGSGAISACSPYAALKWSMISRPLAPPS